MRRYFENVSSSTLFLSDAKARNANSISFLRSNRLMDNSVFLDLKEILVNHPCSWDVLKISLTKQGSAQQDHSHLLDDHRLQN